MLTYRNITWYIYFTYFHCFQSERESSASLTLSIEAEIDNVEQLENERAELVLQSQVVAVTIDALKQDRLKVSFAF